MTSVTDFVLDEVAKKKEDAKPVVVCEIGSGEGVTSKKILEVLDKYDTYYFFDYSKKVESLKKEIDNYPSIKIGIGNSYKSYDSYAWNLGKLYLTLKKAGICPRLFDIVYVDGSNIFLHDLSACVILKKMVKDNGQIIINNLNWSFGKSKYWSPQNNPKTREMLTDEQISTSQIAIVCELLFDDDEYVKIENNNNNFVSYVKIKK